MFSKWKKKRPFDKRELRVDLHSMRLGGIIESLKKVNPGKPNVNEMRQEEILHLRSVLNDDWGVEL